MALIAPTHAGFAPLLLALGDLAHQLQLERGCTALVVDSKGEIFSGELRTQYLATDAAFERLMPAMQSIGALQLDLALEIKLTSVVDTRAELAAHRAQIQAAETSFAKAINAYTYRFIAPIIELCIELALHIKAVNPIKVSAYSNLLQWKERVGRERAWGAHGFCSNAFRNREFSERMISLIEEQGACKRAFFSLATPAQKRNVEKALSGYVMECLDSIHAQLKNGDAAKDIEKLSPVTWFELLTGKINRLHMAEKELIVGMDASGNVPLPPTRKPLRPDKLVPYMPLIQALPAFSQFSGDELDRLLSHADIRTYEKGKLLFLQGESLTRFYLILEGWVKVFKGTDAGEEAILQMLSAGDSLMEAAVFLGIPSIVSAQLVQKTTLLSIPAPLIRQSLLDNRKFAMNMIGSLSLRSQGLIRQIEHSRLKTATERVGWFLLQLGIEQSGGKASTITLPYDKSTTASYLDMTRETFSRTLKQFRDKGFRVDNDKIIKPDSEALCQFCDDTLASACIYKDKETCPQTYLG